MFNISSPSPDLGILVGQPPTGPLPFI